MAKPKSVGRSPLTSCHDSPALSVRLTPAHAIVIAAEHPCSRYGDVDALGVAGIDDDRVQTHPPGTWLPRGASAMLAESRDLSPALTAIGGAEESRVLNSGKDGVGIGQRWFEVPDPREFPRVGRAVVPLVRAGRALVLKLVAHRLPRRPTVV